MKSWIFRSEPTIRFIVRSVWLAATGAAVAVDLVRGEYGLAAQVTVIAAVALGFIRVCDQVADYHRAITERAEAEAAIAREAMEKIKAGSFAGVVMQEEPAEGSPLITPRGGKRTAH